MNNYNLIIKCKDNDIKLLDSKLHNNSSIVLSNIIKFNYNKQYNIYIKKLKETNIIKTLNPLFTCNIDLSDFNSKTINIYINYIILDLYIKNNNIYIVHNNLFEYLESICFANYILDNNWFNLLINNLNFNINNLIKNKLLYKKNTVDKICITILLLKNIDLNIIYIPNNCKNIIKNYNTNKYFLQIEEEIYNKFIICIYETLINIINYDLINKNPLLSLVEEYL